MQEKKPEPRTVCDKIVKTFLDQLIVTRGCEEIAGRLEEAILNEKPTEAAIRSALFNEEIS